MVTGIAHLYLMNSETAKYYLKVAISLNRGSHFAHRMLGRAYLIEGVYESAADEFDKSVKLLPLTVMAHQNYAGRYDVLTYKPKQWELARAGELLTYDNLMQLAEDLFLQGRFDESFRFYQSALSFQSRIAETIELPRWIQKRVENECNGFDPSLPIRILPYEWVTQFGHIGLLDSYTKMAKLGMIPKANYILLAPRSKVSNLDYLAYWDRYFCIVRNQALIDELFPYQRYFGDHFMAMRSSEAPAEPWTRAAARAQIEWAKRGHRPLLELEMGYKQQGERMLRKLGLPPDAWYVGLHVREGGFYGDGMGTVSEHRSAIVEDYYGAIEEVTSRGGWVVRLGDTSMKPLPDMPNVIDYIHSAEKSALMDLFLLATSRFVIGTTSGLSTVAMTFGTPMLLVNCISNDWQIWTENTDFIVKQIYDLNEHRYLSLAETYRQPFQGQLINYALVRRRGFAVHSNSASDIRAAVRYKLDVMLDVTARANEDHPLMRRYREALSENAFMFGAAKPSLPFLEAHPELLSPLPDLASTRREKHSAA
jgi:putative glycosyltransferase (TIGR04372 family)